MRRRRGRKRRRPMFSPRTRYRLERALPATLWAFLLMLRKYLSPEGREFNQVNREVKKFTHGRVLNGPFTGMKYIGHATGSRLGPKLVGTYEQELHESIENLINDNPQTIIVVGSAEGYYAVGLAVRTGAVVHAVDSSPHAAKLCTKLAKKNRVGERVITHGALDKRQLSFLIKGPTSIVMDCEGCEIDLLCGDNKWARNVSLIVECHDHIVPAATERVVKSLGRTHAVSVIEATRREIGGVHPAWIDEGRPLGMRWVIARSSEIDR